MTLRLYLAPGPGPDGLAPGAEQDLPPGAARHVQVRRAQPGDPLVLFDGRGGEWSAEVLRMERQRVSVRIGAHDPVERELPLAVTLAVGMPANDRMDWLVEKATELGVHTVQPLVTERSVLRLAGERADRKQAHWQGIAVAAAEQSGRTRVPAVAAVQTLSAWLAGRGPERGPDPGPDGAAALRWVLSPQAVPRPGSRPTGGAVLALSGPEGGLTPDELVQAVAHGFHPVSLGTRVLRADTAPLALLAALSVAL
jgi:16S rRNA (uracil1498-N3)-methyltransferase